MNQETVDAQEKTVSFPTRIYEVWWKNNIFKAMSPENKKHNLLANDDTIKMSS